jgi:hypothetical protein
LIDSRIANAGQTQIPLCRTWQYVNETPKLYVILPFFFSKTLTPFLHVLLSTLNVMIKGLANW